MRSWTPPFNAVALGLDSLFWPAGGRTDGVRIERLRRLASGGASRFRGMRVRRSHVLPLPRPARDAIPPGLRPPGLLIQPLVLQKGQADVEDDDQGEASSDYRRVRQIQIERKHGADVLICYQYQCSVFSVPYAYALRLGFPFWGAEFALEGGFAPSFANLFLGDIIRRN